MDTVTAGGEAFGALLKRYRLGAGLSQEALAERAGLTAHGVSALERGVRQAPYHTTVRLLATALGLAAAEQAALEAAVVRTRARRVGPAPTTLSARWPGDRSPPGSPSSDGPPLPPFVGRTTDLALLERHLLGFSDGSPLPVLLLAGQPGIGKTRLLQETARRAERQGLVVLQGGCGRRGGQDPYAPLVDALQWHLQARTPARARAELRGCAWLARLLPELAASPEGETPLLDALPAWTLPPQQERRLIGAAVARFLANLASLSGAGVLLVLDDLQWAGADALDLLVTLARSPQTPVRLLGAYRDTEAHPGEALAVTLADLTHAGLATQRLLGPLSAVASAALLEGLLQGVQGRGSTLEQRLVARAGGLPFYLVSLAEELRAQALDSTAPAAGYSDEVPWNLAQTLRHQVAGLPAAAREMLGVAAVIGRVVSRALLAAVVMSPEEELLAALAAACRQRLLLDEGPAYRFAHDVVREVVESDLGLARRTLLHRQIAEALLAASPDPPVEEIAYHYGLTEEHGEAACWLERAGDRAAASRATGAALQHYSAARERLVAGGSATAALSQLDEKLGDLRLLTGAYSQAQEDFAHARMHEQGLARRADLARKEGVTWARRGEFARALATFAIVEGQENGDGPGTGLPPAVQAAVELSRGEVHYQQGDYGAMARAARRVRAALAAEGLTAAGSRTLAQISVLEGHVACLRGAFVEAEESYRCSLTLQEPIGDQEGIATSWNGLGFIAYMCGAFAQAEECYRHGLTIQESIGDRGGAAGSWNRLGVVAYDRGDRAAAEQCYRQSLLLREQVGDMAGITQSLIRLGDLALDRGEHAQAQDYYQRGLCLQEHVDDHAGIAWSRIALAEVSLERGDLSRAEEGLQSSLAVFERLQDLAGIANSWDNLGRVAFLRGDFARAEHCYRRSLAIEEHGGYQRGIAAAYRRLGEVAAARGDHAQAEQYAQRSQSLFERLGGTDRLVRGRQPLLPPTQPA